MPCCVVGGKRLFVVADPIAQNPQSFDRVADVVAEADLAASSVSACTRRPNLGSIREGIDRAVEPEISSAVRPVTRPDLLLGAVAFVGRR